MNLLTYIPHGRIPANVRQELRAATPSCPDDASDAERLYWLKHDLRERPKCTCGALTSFINGTQGYRTWCSRKCAKGSAEEKAKLKATSLALYGVDHPLKSEAVQAKRHATNLERYGDKHPGRWESSLFKERMKAKHGVEHAQQDAKVRERTSASLRQAFIGSGKLAERLREIYELEDVSLQQEYIAHDAAMAWRHVCGHTFMSNLADGKIPSCPSCNAKSRPELELYEAVRELVPGETVLRNDRTVIKPLELDVYLPERKLALELNGVYYHSDLFLQERAKSYHLSKTLLCEQQGVRLVHIFDYEWYDHRPKIISKLQSLLGVTERIWARKLRVVNLDPRTKNQFLERAHLQGKDIARVPLGLVNAADEVVAAMTFCKPRFSKSYEWELSRYACKPGVTVVGGAGKLLAAFIKRESPSSLVTYADARFSSGNLYNKLGFRLIGRSAPSYKYIKGDVLLTRYQAQKHLLPKVLGDKFNSMLTEGQNMAANGWHRVYDCGNLVYELRQADH